MRKLLSAVACLALLLGSGAAAFQNDETSSPKLRISWADFKKLHDSKEAVVVDVRPVEAYELGHIPGSRSIPLDDIEKHVEQLKKLNKPIVVYCA